jgi:predicted alpha/beta-hydrolase family hydrolase
MNVDTPHGPARVYLHPADEAVALLVLGHGANGQVRAPDLLTATETANARGVSVALVEQPYKVAGRRAPAPAAQLDVAFTAVVEHVRDEAPVIVGGRSMGARVACRTADALGAIGVLCLAFPVHPPGRPEKSRLEELDAATAPVLVVQGTRDAFGMPPPAPGREIVQIEGGDHSLKRDLDAVAEAVGGWLTSVTRSPRARART